MGKYMRKPKAASAEVVAVMEVSQSSFGVRTRAKTLALQRLQNSGAPVLTTVDSAAVASSGSYLQLRSRRLEKPPIDANNGHHTRRHNKHNQSPKEEGCMRNPNPKPIPNSAYRASSRLRSVTSGSGGSVSLGNSRNCGSEDVTENNINTDVGIIEASLGENVLDFECRERGTRESTPCSLIRDPDTMRTPGSTTRCSHPNQRIENSVRRIVPTAHEMDEFFAGVEEQQQRLFIEKYNFDPVNDMPLPGRFEWEEVDP